MGVLTEKKDVQWIESKLELKNPQDEGQPDRPVLMIELCLAHYYSQRTNACICYCKYKAAAVQGSTLPILLDDTRYLPSLLLASHLVASVHITTYNLQKKAAALLHMGE